MKKSEIFQKVLSVVSEHTETSQELILSTSRKTETVDARSIAIYYWKRYGLQTDYLMQKLNRNCHNSIQYLYNQYYSRQKTNRQLRHLCQTIGQELDNLLPNVCQ